MMPVVKDWSPETTNGRPRYWLAVVPKGAAAVAVFTVPAVAAVGAPTAAACTVSL